MNERFRQLEKQSFITTETQKISGAWDNIVEPFRYVTVTETNFSLEKFAELIVAECTAVLFDESERLSRLYSEEANWQQAEEYEICSNQCIDDIALIEKHFGVKE